MGFDDPPPYTPTVGAPLQREISLTDAIDGQASSARTTRAQRESFLRTTELPAGMQEAMLASVQEFPLRIWIIDNSGSMQSGDGHVLAQKAGTEALVGCTRWQELGDALRWHARMAAYMSAPTEFRFLNPPSGGLQTMHCGTTADPESEIRALESVLACGPRGLTPLCAQIRQVVQRVQEEAPRLRAKGQRCTVVIASDGEASDGSVEQALRPLLHLPVWVVIRLCTDEDKVVEYWNGIDAELELEMDVLDDLCGEAGEVAEHNPWLTYGTPLHRVREWGTSRKVVDMLDERRLTAAEFMDFAALVLGRDAVDGLPNPSVDWPSFKDSIQQRLAAVPLVWDPIRRRRKPWFSITKLSRCYQPRGSCVIS